VILAWMMCTSQVARAHDLSQSESRIEIDGATVRVRLTINLLELSDVDVDRDERVSYDELDRAIDRVFDQIKRHFQLRAAGGPRRIVLDQHRIVEDHVLEADLLYTFDQDVRELEVTSTIDGITRPDHRHLVTLVDKRGMQRAVLNASNPTGTFAVPGITVNRILATLAGLLGLVCLAVYRFRGGRASVKIR
jgi:hypothetical protein